MKKSYVGVPWKAPQEWFLKSLEIIDPSYYIVYNQEYNYYQVMKDVRVFGIDLKGNLEKQDRTTILGTFRHPNEDALEDLRRRKKFSLRFNRASSEDDDNAYLDWIAEQNRENNKKAKELSIEMRADGYMKMYRSATAHTVHMPGGNDGSSRSQDGRP